MPDNEITDLAGLGQLADSELVNEVYKDAVSPAIKEAGKLAEDTVKALRLISAPIQLAAAFQDRLTNFCERVRNKVPEEFQQAARANIAKPVIEAIAFTEDDSPLMAMFEELMSKAIDSREALKLNPSFPELIKSLTPYQAKIVTALTKSDQYSDDFIETRVNMIVERLHSNFSSDEFGGLDHHLTLMQDLERKGIVYINPNFKIEPSDKYSSLTLKPHHTIKRTRYSLTMHGRWLADCCIERPKESQP